MIKEVPMSTLMTGEVQDLIEAAQTPWTHFARGLRRPHQLLVNSVLFLKMLTTTTKVCPTEESADEPSTHQMDSNGMEATSVRMIHDNLQFVEATGAR